MREIAMGFAYTLGFLLGLTVWIGIIGFVMVAIYKLWKEVSKMAIGR